LNEKAIALSRLVDRWLGGLICVFLSLLSKLGGGSRPQSRSTSESEIGNVAFIKLFGGGSILLSAPALCALKKTLGNAKITFVTFSSNREFARLIDGVDEVLTIDDASLLKLALSTMKLVSSVRRARFDAVIDLEFFSTLTAFISFFSRARIRAGLRYRWWRNELYTRLYSFAHGKHITEIYGKAAAAVVEGVERHFDSCRFELKADGGAVEIDDIVAGCKTGRIVCLNINAGQLFILRRWPKERFKELVEHLTSEGGVDVILIGGGEDVSYVNSFFDELSRTENVMNLVGKLRLRELVELFRHSALYVGNDSSVLHLAVALGVPTVSFFGPETPALYGPRGEKHEIFYENLHCSPCLSVYNFKSSGCKDNVCLKRIGVGEVIRACKRILTENR